MPEVNKPLPSEAPSVMLASVIEYLTVKTIDTSSEQMSLRLHVPASWIRAIRENRITKPDINRVEYIFRTCCNGVVSVNKSV